MGTGDLGAEPCCDLDSADEQAAARTGGESDEHKEDDLVPGEDAVALRDSNPEMSP